MEKLTRREFLKFAGTAAIGAAAYNLGVNFNGAGQAAASGSKAKVYFAKDITAENLIKLYDLIGGDIGGRVAIKVHTGEPHGPNILPRDLVKALQQHIPNSNLVETNTLYAGGRDTTEKHRATIKLNGWDFCPVDIMDEEGTAMLPVKGGKYFTEMSMGSHILNYDSMVVLTHFKGHASGGFGGSLKNIAIGCADGKVGKRMVHGARVVEDLSTWIRGAKFQERMAESGKATIDHFGRHIVYINVLRNMSVDCDCAGTAAAPPVAPDLGILASTDILAVDKASVDMVYALPDKYSHDLKERIESREGLRQLSRMQELGMGNADYEIINI